MRSYLIEYDEFKEIHINHLPVYFKNWPGIKLSEISIMDLCIFNATPIFPGNGVYIFKTTSNEIIYVGKCASRCFAERIPSHFDQRPGGWFNNMLKIRLRALNRVCNDETLKEITKQSFYDLQLLLIHFRNHNPDSNNLGNKINQLEALLLKTIEPLNKSKRTFPELIQSTLKVGEHIS